MSDAKHTPGPWKLDQRSGCLAVYPATDDRNCLSGASNFAIHYSNKGAKFNGSFWDMDEQAKADARLISAAPELLAALVAVTETLAWLNSDNDGHIMAQTDNARAVIAKATEVLP